MFKTILVSSDFSPASWKALRVGISLKEKYDCSLSVVHIFPTEDSKNISDDQLQRIKKVQKSMEKMSSEFTNASEKVNNLVLPGRIEQELLKFVKEQKFDLVIMGVNGNGEDNVPGRHTASILEKSTSPILVIPNSYSLND